MAKFTSSSFQLAPTPSDDADRQAVRQVVEDVTRRFQPDADALVRDTDAAVRQRQALIDSISDPDLKRSVGAPPGMLTESW